MSAQIPNERFREFFFLKLQSLRKRFEGLSSAMILPVNATVLANTFYENPTLRVDNIIEKCSNEQYQNNLHVVE